MVEARLLDVVTASETRAGVGDASEFSDAGDAGEAHDLDGMGSAPAEGVRGAHVHVLALLVLGLLLDGGDTRMARIAAR